MTDKPQNNWFAMEATKDVAASADVYIYDEIGGYEVNAQSFMDELDALGEIETINLRINSPGGSIVEGNVIYNTLKRHSAKVVTHIDGIAASMASVIAMAGDEIHMASNAFLMIHNPWTVSVGDSDKLRKDADLMDKMKLNIINAYSRSGYSTEELEQLMDAETWLTADEALKAEFIDEIEGGLEAAASIGDMNAALEKIDKTLPVDKIVASIAAKHKSEVEEIRASFEAEAKELNAEIASNVDQLAKNAVQIAEFEAKETALTEQIDTIVAKHEVELGEARSAGADLIAAKAAEIMMQNTVTPVSSDNENVVNMFASTDEYWNEYNRQEPGKKNAWHLANKSRLPK